MVSFISALFLRTCGQCCRFAISQNKSYHPSPVPCGQNDCTTSALNAISIRASFVSRGHASRINNAFHRLKPLSRTRLSHKKQCLQFQRSYRRWGDATAPSYAWRFTIPCSCTGSQPRDQRSCDHVIDSLARSVRASRQAPHGTHMTRARHIKLSI